MIKDLCYLLWKYRGWKIENHLSKDIKKAVVIGVPHTSNWDFITSMFFLKAAKLKGAKFAIKKEWVDFPLGFMFKNMGAIGIDRSKYSGKVSTTKVLSDLFEGKDEFMLMIAPEGTRKANDKWKTGFYYVAKEADVPIICMKADYTTKTIHMGEKVIDLTNFEDDMKEMMNYYKNSQAQVPENFKLDSRFV